MFSWWRDRTNDSLSRAVQRQESNQTANATTCKAAAVERPVDLTAVSHPWAAPVALSYFYLPCRRRLLDANRHALFCQTGRQRYHLRRVGRPGSTLKPKMRSLALYRPACSGCCRCSCCSFLHSDWSTAALERTTPPMRPATICVDGFEARGLRPTAFSRHSSAGASII